MKKNNFLSVLILLVTIFSNYIYSQTENLTVATSVLEIYSTTTREIDFQICFAESEADPSIPLEVKNLTTPFRDVIRSGRFAAIIKCEDPSLIKTKLISLDEDDNEISTLEGNAGVFLISSDEEECTFTGIE